MMAQALLMTFSCILCYKHNKRNAVNTAISQEQNTLLYMVEIIWKATRQQAKILLLCFAANDLFLLAAMRELKLTVRSRRGLVGSVLAY